MTENKSKGVPFFGKGHRYYPPKKQWDTPTRTFTEGFDRYFKAHPRKIDDMIKIAIERAIETKDLKWFDWITTTKEGKVRQQTVDSGAKVASPDAVLKKAADKAKEDLKETLDKIGDPGESKVVGQQSSGTVADVRPDTGTDTGTM